VKNNIKNLPLLYRREQFPQSTPDWNNCPLLKEYMKFIKELSVPSVLLVGYCVYSTIVPATIPHSIIILALAVLCGYHTHISRQTTIKYNEEVLSSLKNEFETQMAVSKEQYEKRLSKMEDELAKLHLNSMPQKTGSSPSPQPRKMGAW